MKRISKLIILVLTFSSTCLLLKAQNNTGENTSLSPQQKSLIEISVYTAQGNLTKLKEVLPSGLDAGLTVNQIKEAMLHLYAYAGGFPRSICGSQSFMAVTEERKSQGINDLIGESASAILVTHSHSGGRGWLTAIKNPNVKAIVSYEPGSGFVFPEGELPPPVPSSSGPLEV